MVRLPKRAAFFIVKNAGVNAGILIIINYANKSWDNWFMNIPELIKQFQFKQFAPVFSGNK